MLGVCRMRVRVAMIERVQSMALSGDSYYIVRLAGAFAR